MEPKTKKASAVIEKAKDLGDGVVEAIVATDSLDRDGERLDIKGLDLSHYKKNPVVLWAHDYSSPPIGETMAIKKTADGKLVAKVRFAIAEYDFAHTIYKLVKGGFQRAWSIGFIPRETDEEGTTFTKAEMLEHSAVPVPANAEALSLAYSKGVIAKEELEQAEKSLVPEEGDAETKRGKQILRNLDAVEMGIEMLAGTTLKAMKELKEYKKLDHAGASRKKRVVRLVKVRSATQFAQTVSQSLNRELGRNGAVNRHKRIKKRLKVRIN